LEKSNTKSTFQKSAAKPGTTHTFQKSAAKPGTTHTFQKSAAKPGTTLGIIFNKTSDINFTRGFAILF
jgi:hypothetical protein